MQICMVILSHFPLKDGALIWVALNIMTPVLSLEISFESDFCGGKTSQRPILRWAESLSPTSPIFWTSRMGPDLDDAKVSKSRRLERLKIPETEDF